MVDVLERARTLAKKAMEDIYFTEKCDVIEMQSVRDERTKIVKASEVKVLENQPCKVSYGSLNIVGQTSTGATNRQTVKLFISPNVIIKPGSKVVVGRNAYKASGVPAVYTDTHQEIMLDMFDRWA
nr:MAG TPA: head closure knob [Caudoviricetes sp.]